MNINIMAKGFDLVDGTRVALENELSDLNKLVKADPNYRVTLKKRDYGEYECTISTVVNCHDYNIRVTRKSIRSCIEAATKSLKEKILDDKSKMISKKLGAATDDWSAIEKEHKGQTKKVVTKEKEVQLIPISDDEAIAELNASDKDMYMYLDESTLEVKGVYHRAEGYGVITFKTT